MIFHNIEQNTPEWIELRKGKFTASTFSDLFMKENTAGYKNALYKVVFERLTGETPDNFSSKWMERGHEYEDMARYVYELETFNKVRNGGFWEYSEWIGCSPDGLIGNDGLAEIKCPKYNTIIEYLLTGKLPKIYEWQIHGQLMVTDRKWCDFVAYHPNLKPLTIRVNRDEKKIVELKDKLEESIEKAKCIVEKLRGIKP